jgi:Tfp pilus assembly ATPase PilU
MSQLQRATEQNLATHQKYSTRIHTMEQELAEAMRQKAEVNNHSSNPKSDIYFWNFFENREKPQLCSNCEISVRKVL